MAKRRNKNKKAGPVKIIRPAEVAAPVAEAAPDADGGESIESAAAALAAGEPALATEAALVPEETLAAGAEDDAASAADVVALDEGAGADDQVPEAPVPDVADAITDGADTATSAGPVATAADEWLPDAAETAAPEAGDGWVAAEPQPEFDDASALLAQDHELVAGFEASGSASEPLPGIGDEATGESPAAPVEVAAELDEAPAGFEVAPEPVAAEPERIGPAEPRIAAFAKLTEYQTLSLAHVAGLPEEADVPGHWRGVGFGIAGRRFVAGFDEVVEVIRMPVITHVPGTQPWMLGVANVRGTLLPVVDLKQFLEGERTVVYEGQRVMVVRQGGGNVAVLIDQLYGQRTFNDSHKTDVQPDSDSRYGYFIKQVYRVGDNDWAVFSMAMLTRTPEFRQAAA